MFLKNSLRRAGEAKKKGPKASTPGAGGNGMGAAVTAGNHKNTLKKAAGKASPQFGGSVDGQEEGQVAKLTAELRSVLADVEKFQQAA